MGVVRRWKVRRILGVKHLGCGLVIELILGYTVITLASAPVQMISQAFPLPGYGPAMDSLCARKKMVLSLNKFLVFAGIGIKLIRFTIFFAFSRFAYLYALPG